MRYEKPQVLDLGAGARRAAGQTPLSCMAGDTPLGGGKSLRDRDSTELFS